MKKISIQNIIKYRRTKSKKGKSSFIKSLDKDRKPDSKGGDYWISSVSALSHAFEDKDNQIIKDKIEHLIDEHAKTSFQITKTMYERNIKILYNYVAFDFSELQPACDLIFLSRPRVMSILNINAVAIQVLPSHVFSYINHGVKTIGAIWFVAKLEGYKSDELGIFTEALHRYLMLHYSDKYQIDSTYCTAIDIFSNRKVNYVELENNQIPSLLDSLIDEIKSI
jgi:hypothetical protein